MSTYEPRFGTDGVRGVANAELTPLVALKLGTSAAYVLSRHASNRRIVVGRDPRLSGAMLQAALMAGLASQGCHVLNIGIVPTPAVSRLTIRQQAMAGAVVSASHNPFDDNGIKFFGPNGKKLSDAAEEEIEATMKVWENLPRPVGREIGQIIEAPEAVAEYAAQVKRTANSSLKGMRLVLDCANGAAYQIAPALFEDLGAEVIAIHTTPDGVNINDNCGSTKPADLCAHVRAVGADAGLAFDGDCDRVMMCDERGEIVDGDRMMAICALGMKERGELTNDLVVATVMSNAGLEVALEQAGIRLIRTDVGDRYVAEEMARTGAVIGGEQSGHLLLPRLTPTGDGMVTGLQVLGRMRATGRKLSELADAVPRFPQILRNIRVRNRTAWQEIAEIQDAIAAARTRLGKPEWLSVRASGTEPLIRVMAQDRDAALVEETVDTLCVLIEKYCNR